MFPHSRSYILCLNANGAQAGKCRVNVKSCGLAATQQRNAGCRFKTGAPIVATAVLQYANLAEPGESMTEVIIHRSARLEGLI